MTPPPGHRHRRSGAGPTRAQSPAAAATPPPAMATPSPSTATIASSVHPSSSPQLAERVAEADARGTFAHPVEHLGVGRAVREAGAGRVARADPGQQRTRRAAHGERPDERGGRPVGVAMVLHPVHAAGHPGDVAHRHAAVAGGGELRHVRLDGSVEVQPGPPRRGAPARTWSPRPRGTGRAGRARRRTRRAPAPRRRAPETPSSPSGVELVQLQRAAQIQGMPGHGVRARVGGRHPLIRPRRPAVRVDERRAWRAISSPRVSWRAAAWCSPPWACPAPPPRSRTPPARPR